MEITVDTRCEYSVSSLVDRQSLRQISRPSWGACQSGLRSRTTSAPAVAPNQAGGVVAFPPLQTYSEEESMMRDAGEQQSCVPAAAESWRQNLLIFVTD